MNTVHYFKALADETRLRLYHLLMEYEFNVNEIVSIMGMGQSRISRHLKILTDSGLLAGRRDGSYMYYHSVNSDELQDLARFVDKSLKREQEFNQDQNRAQELVRERKSRTQRFFNDIAEEWDSLKRDVFGEFDIVARLAEKIDTCAVAVDLGCGTGELLIALAGKAKQVIGVDSSPKMLEQARLRSTSANQRIELRLGELEHLPVRDAEADVAVYNMVLHHLVVPATGIREAHRILAPGGRLLIADFNKHQLEMVRDKYGDPWLGFDRDEIETWLHDAGFDFEGLEQYDVLQGLTVNVFTARRP